MKHLCYSRYIFALLVLTSTLFASLNDKSAIVYFGKNISYPMVGIHDYIIVNPKNIDTVSHGFKVYKNKIYAKINPNKTEFEDKIDDGYENFYFEIEKMNSDTEDFINSIHSKYPKTKIIVNADITSLDKISHSISTLLVENSLKKDISQFKKYGLDIIALEYKKSSNDDNYIIEKINSKGLIPYIGNVGFTTYGKSVKNAVKREILTLIDESEGDRMFSSAHKHGAMPMEYLGYIQKLHDINDGLPSIENINHYAGIVIWLSKDYAYPQKLIQWVLAINKLGIKTVFINNFGSGIDKLLVSPLGIKIFDGNVDGKQVQKITHKDEMIGFEIEPSLSGEKLYLQPNNAQALLTYENENKLSSTPSAITNWGGYVIYESFMLELNDENIWVINPFEFFSQALRLPKLIVPDPTTENGNRLLFTHIDGDGIMNSVESYPEKVSGDMILERVLKTYKIPHSVSLIGSDISAKGLYPELSIKSSKLAKKMYALDNVEGATHTFSHPFAWSKIKNDNLDEEYRYKIKDYQFSINSEIRDPLSYINANLDVKDKNKAKTVFWSGDCMPSEDILKYTYKNNILNINGGSTNITHTNPYLTNVSALGLQRGEYYQVYTGAENENIYTNGWTGPYWGFKKVVQTFKMTDSPRRLKPIDVYYQLYSGSKIASLNALKFVFEWAIKQDVMPIYTSEYIPKVMDYYTVSMARDENDWLVDGMRDLKTLRIEEKNAYIDFTKSRSSLGIKHFEKHTYVSLDNSNKHYLSTSETGKPNKSSFLVSSNSALKSYKNGELNQEFVFNGHVDLKLNFHLSENCKLSSIPKADKLVKKNENLHLSYVNTKKAVINVNCR